MKIETTLYKYETDYWSKPFNLGEFNWDSDLVICNNFIKRHFFKDAKTTIF